MSGATEAIRAIAETTTEATTEAEAEKVEAVDVEQESSPEAMEAEKQSRRDRGAEARIGKLTAQYKSELEKRDAEINLLKERFNSMTKPEVEETSIDTIDDLLRIMDEKISKTVEDRVKERLLSETKETQTRSAQETYQKNNEKFAEKVLEVYGKDFDGDIFVGDEKTKDEIQTVMTLFQGNQIFWLDKLEKRGIGHIIDIVRDENKTEKKKETVDRILDAASKSVATKGSGNNISDQSTKRYSTAGELLRAIINKGGSK